MFTCVLCEHRLVVPHVFLLLNETQVSRSSQKERVSAHGENNETECKLNPAAHTAFLSTIRAGGEPIYSGSQFPLPGCYDRSPPWLNEAPGGCYAA